MLWLFLILAIEVGDELLPKVIPSTTQFYKTEKIAFKDDETNHPARFRYIGVRQACGLPCRYVHRSCERSNRMAAFLSWWHFQPNVYLLCLSLPAVYSFHCNKGTAKSHRRRYRTLHISLASLCAPSTLRPRKEAIFGYTRDATFAFCRSNCFCKQ
jgi:hypothetical protein